jgi:heme-degrading monooxygenase HmoA
MLLVIYRGMIKSGQEEFFKEAWEKLTRAALEQMKGSRGMALMRNHDNPNEFIVIARWDTFEDWRVFWSSDLTKSEWFKQMFLSAEKITTEIFDEIKNLWE